MVWRLGCSVVDGWLHIVVIVGTKTMNVHCGCAIFIISLHTKHRLVFHVQFSFFVFREKGPGTCTRARELLPLVTALLAVLILVNVSCSAL